MKSKNYSRTKLIRPDLGSLKDSLNQRIIGQPEVISRLTEDILRRETEAIPQHGPRGAFFFCGPTGTGKNATVEALTEFLFGPGHLAVVDCAEFKSVESMEGLLGNRDGDPGRFAEMYAKVPAGVWIFDEIEKAQKDLITNLFLQMVGEGRITAANGRTIDLSGIYIFVTSNLGSAEILGRQYLPFSSLERHVIKRVEQYMRPELLGRFGTPFVFRPLGRAAQSQIVVQKLSQLIAWQKTKGRSIEVEPAVISFLVQRGFSDRLGARPLIATVESLVGNAIVANVVKGLAESGRLVVHNNQLELVP